MLLNACQGKISVTNSYCPDTFKFSQESIDLFISLPTEQQHILINDIDRLALTHCMIKYKCYPDEFEQECGWVNLHE